MTITVTKSGPRPDPETVILLFVNHPDPGETGTRLARAVGPEMAARLEKAFAEDILDTLDKNRFTVILCHHPEDKLDEFKAWLGPDRKYLAQEGADAGQRMKNALARIFEAGCEYAAVLGTNVPDLSASALRQADDSLSRYGTSVLGPKGDGGYFLIGFEKEAFLPQVFDNVDWDSDTVFDKTLEVCGDHGSIPVFLPGHDDAADEKGLRALYERNLNTGFAESRTYALLRELFGQEAVEKAQSAALSELQASLRATQDLTPQVPQKNPDRLCMRNTLRVLDFLLPCISHFLNGLREMNFNRLIGIKTYSGDFPLPGPG